MSKKLLAVSLVAVLVVFLGLTSNGANYETIFSTGRCPREGWQIIDRSKNSNEEIYVTTKDKFEVDNGEVKLPAGSNGLPIRVIGKHGWGHGNENVGVWVIEKDLAAQFNKMGEDYGDLQKGFDFFIHPGKNELDATAEVEVWITNSGDYDTPECTLEFDVNLQWW